MYKNDVSTVQSVVRPLSQRGGAVLTVLFSFLVPLAVVAALVLFVVSKSPSATGPAFSEKAIADRLKKIGSLELRDANRPMKSGEQVFQAACVACHGTGALGAPKLGDASAWGPRVKTGFDALLQSALKGKGNMSAQGGGAFDDFEIARAVVYMANGSGGKLAEPVKAEGDAK